MEYIRLKDLVDKEFTVEEVTGWKWKKWDADNKKMLVASEYQEGYAKKYQVKTDKGMLDIGTGQMGSLLEASFDYRIGGSQFNGETFQVKSNGKSGMEIRYFFNKVRPEENPGSERKVKESTYDPEPLPLEDVPY